MSQFAFLQREWGAVYEAASKAEAGVHADPRTACFYARRALELAVSWAYKFDPGLKLPYQDNLSALIHEPTFKQTAGEAVFAKAKMINTLGNRAVHSHRAVPEADAIVAVRELFHVSYWLARTYGRVGRPAPGLTFNAAALPKPAQAGKQTAEQLQALEARFRERDESLAALLAEKAALDQELKRLRAEVAKAKQAAAAQPVRTTTPKLRRATTSSTSCSRRRDGRSIRRATASSRSVECPTRKARASSTMCFGAMTENRWDSSRPSARGAMPALGNSRRSSTPTVSSASSVGGR